MLIVDAEDYNMLKKLYLSLRTYRRTSNVARKARFELGVCKQCRTAMICIKKQGLPSVKPGYTFISNGMMFGAPPPQLQ
jgi:hypothetical protein